MTAPATDVDLLHALDFTPELPCNGKKGTCGRDADWALLTSCDCDTFEYICDRCRAHIRIAVMTGRIRCTYCKTPVELTWRPLR